MNETITWFVFKEQEIAIIFFPLMKSLNCLNLMSCLRNRRNLMSCPACS
jgi:hypothetical protein